VWPLIADLAHHLAVYPPEPGSSPLEIGFKTNHRLACESWDWRCTSKCTAAWTGQSHIYACQYRTKEKKPHGLKLEPRASHRRKSDYFVLCGGHLSHNDQCLLHTSYFTFQVLYLRTSARYHLALWTFTPSFVITQTSTSIYLHLHQCVKWLN